MTEYNVNSVDTGTSTDVEDYDETNPSIHPRTAEAIHVVGEMADMYGDRAEERKWRGEDLTGKLDEYKHTALARTKSKALDRILRYIYDLALYDVGGEEYLCLYFIDHDGGLWSYYQPAGEMSPEDINEFWAIKDLDLPLEARSRDKLNPWTDNKTGMSLESALLHLDEVHLVNANDELPKQYVEHDYRHEFLGWECLRDE